MSVVTQARLGKVSLGEPRRAMLGCGEAGRAGRHHTTRSRSMIKRGDRAEDRVSGLTGLVIGRSEYLFSGPQILLVPQEVKDGQPVSGTWLDEDRCKALPGERVERRAGFNGGAT